MSGDEFTRLFKHMNVRFDHIEKVLETKADKADLDRIIGLLDPLVKRQETYEHEQLAMGDQVGRLQDWAEKAAPKVKVRFVR